jgi:hypothetical protein
MTHTLRRVRLAGVFVALTFWSACGRQAQTAAERPAPSASEPRTAQPSIPAKPDSTRLPQWMQVDSTGRTMTLDLVVTSPPGSQSALINGYRAGEVQVTVPAGWTVKWDWRSTDSTAPHSLVLMVEREKIPLEGGRPAFSNAMTRMVTAGLRPGENDQTAFVAEEAGWYWLLCGVPEHALKGEWISLKVDREASFPSVVVKKKA